MKEFDLRVNNGGKRLGSGRPKKAKPIKKAVYISQEKYYLLKKIGCNNFNKTVNELIDNHLLNFNTF